MWGRLDGFTSDSNTFFSKPSLQLFSVCLLLWLWQGSLTLTKYLFTLLTSTYLFLLRANCHIPGPCRDTTTKASLSLTFFCLDRCWSVPPELNKLVLSLAADHCCSWLFKPEAQDSRCLYTLKVPDSSRQGMAEGKGRDSEDCTCLCLTDKYTVYLPEWSCDGVSELVHAEPQL